MYKITLVIMLLLWGVALFVPMAVGSLLHAFLVFAVLLLGVDFILGRARRLS
ncbi:MAG: hypothetical protein KJ930_14120 [Gammaproteobacteria bacterium]|jgi:hypothetical protein|nr:hypothetical protein [Gammaproteobacteria bacterium]MBU2180559.1 hypothetical protein [Gammaproteobacteria bacterium]MBU2224375.1 hypothetical protein [Gammaproteobacteria bacterium]MBU2280563.1 hypothetical protein [Gammaproteobacteria bacterium]MBU2427053.1 hypothetical protein [Gammaproteobacteria bacterium]